MYKYEVIIKIEQNIRQYHTVLSIIPICILHKIFLVIEKLSLHKNIL